MEQHKKSEVTNRQPDIALLLVLHWHFWSISNLSQVIRDFYTFKIGPEVVLGARWRSKQKMTSPFDSATLILYRWSVKIFRLSLTVQKLFKFIDLAGNLASWFQNLGFSGVLAPKCNFVSMWLPKGTSLQQTASFEPLCVQIGSAVWPVEQGC